MKLFHLSRWLFLLISSFCVYSAEPLIRSVRVQGTNVVVTVVAPSGARRVSLESRSRAEGSAWAPRAVRRFNAALQTDTAVELSLPKTGSLEVIRARSDESDFPAEVFTGPNQFSAPEPWLDIPAENGGTPPPTWNGGWTGGSTGSTTTTAASTTTTVGSTTTTSGSTTTGSTTSNTTGATTGSTTGATTGASTGSSPRDVVESDIWKVDGDLLYFFNQNRGLQLIEIANPNAPVLRGTFSLPAVGEQMYVHEGRAVLLVRAACANTSASAPTTRVIVVDSATFRQAAEIDLPGDFHESRLVGNMLYVVTFAWEGAGGGQVVEHATHITSIDLAANAGAEVRTRVQVPMSTTAIMATDQFLFLAGMDEIKTFDISSLSGEVRARGSLAIAGRITDKFKMHMTGSTFSAISYGLRAGRWATTLQNFSLLDADNPVKVGELQLALGEQLHATRFDGTRVYIVTYLRIDPLWILDNSNPAAPAILGELHVPGWSTYLEPMGDRLLAMGVDDTSGQRVALSLFDVSNPRAPALLSKTILGQGFSWSEAQANEKAMTVVHSEGMVLTPWQDASGGKAQIIDFDRNSVRARGILNGQLNPRRLAVHRGHALSISERDLVSYDVTDRDAPVLKATLPLSWPVDRSMEIGGHVLQFENIQSTGAAAIRVSSKEQPDRILTTFTFEQGWRIAGLHRADSKLHVALDRVATWQALGGFRTLIFELGALPSLQKLSEASMPEGRSMDVGVEAHWPKPGLLVWAQGGVSENSFAAFDVSDPAAPKYLSRVSFDGLITEPILDGGLFYASHRGFGAGGQIGGPPNVAPEFPTQLRVHIDRGIVGGDYTILFTGTTTGTFQISDGSDGEGKYRYDRLSLSRARIVLTYEGLYAGDIDDIEVDFGIRMFSGWQQVNVQISPMSGTLIPFGPDPSEVRAFVDVIDFADPATPVVRKPVNIPGRLVGVGANGSVLFTLRAAANGLGNILDASAFDGLAAHQFASLALPAGDRAWVDQERIYVASSNRVSVWKVSPATGFESLGAAFEGATLQALEFRGDQAVASDGTAIYLFDISNRVRWQVTNQYVLPCVVPPQLENVHAHASGALWIALRQYGLTHSPAP